MQNLDTKTEYESKFYTGEEIEALIVERMENVDTEQAKIIEDLKNTIKEQRKQIALFLLRKWGLEETFIETVDVESEESFMKSLETLERQAGGKKEPIEDPIRKIMGLH